MFRPTRSTSLEANSNGSASGNTSWQTNTPDWTDTPQSSNNPSGLLMQPSQENASSWGADHNRVLALERENKELTRKLKERSSQNQHLARENLRERQEIAELRLDLERKTIEKDENSRIWETLMDGTAQVINTAMNHNEGQQ
ncbi:uncharacterized protein [Palaemon carinicauda]|uniref:uncharacterized protein n=1 Tax=Palaemon carinicauda TaxID=392227 RepID=UPI0035B60670